MWDKDKDPSDEDLRKAIEYLEKRLEETQKDVSVFKDFIRSLGFGAGK